MSIFLLVLLFIFFSTTVFFGSELLKKFGFIQSFVKASKQMTVWKYDGTYAPWMYTIVLAGKQNFAVLIWLKLKIFSWSGFDYFGFAQSKTDHKIIISTYLGTYPHEFFFFSNNNSIDNSILISCTKKDQALTPDHIYPPHRWQRLGFYG